MRVLHDARARAPLHFFGGVSAGVLLVVLMVLMVPVPVPVPVPWRCGAVVPAARELGSPTKLRAGIAALGQAYHDVES